MKNEARSSNTICNKSFDSAVIGRKIVIPVKTFGAGAELDVDRRH